MKLLRLLFKRRPKARPEQSLKPRKGLRRYYAAAPWMND